ncbi:MAG TPA: tetratricopeptide repeat protein [Polyangiaceae bacterium]|nr:tetratricopeptide repeat protein [Polyangiaceae bacterium]
MDVHTDLARRLLLSMMAVSALGCSEFRARQRAREGNRLFQEGNYAAAVAAYSAAEQLHPMPVVSLNKGLACRQLLIPGAKSRQNEQAVDCALASFRRLKEQNPSDPRADQLYQQTLFDADRFDALARLYTAQLQESPTDLAALNGLIQVYSSSGRWDDALHWTIERATRAPRDAEAQYAVGVLVYTHLFEKGGGTEQSAYDPRPGAAQQAVPVSTPGDITGPARVALAERGIAFLKRALEVRPTYVEAMTYLGLLYRQESFAYFDRPAEWQATVDTAEEYRKRAAALQAQRKPTQP